MLKLTTNFIFVAGLLVSGVVRGQTSQSQAPSTSPFAPDPTIPSDEAAWRALEVNSSGVFPSGPNSAMMQPRFADLAEQAKAFAENYPNHRNAKRAKAAELRALLNESLLGGSVDPVRVNSLLTALRKDQELPAKLRFELVSLSETVRNIPVGSDSAALLSAQEASARRLISEFPAEDAAYEMLLRVALNNSDSTKKTALATEVFQARADTTLGARAKVVVDRQGLVGKSLDSIADTALGKGNSISAIKGKAILIYTWSLSVPGTRADAKRLAAIAPASVTIIGVNLDEDDAGARSMAQTEALPGIQIYNAAGIKSPLVQALLFDTSFPAYVVNSKGVIREVSAQTGNTTDKILAGLN